MQRINSSYFPLLVFGLALWIAPAGAQVYRWVDDEGNVHYSSQLPPEAAPKAHVELSPTGVPVRVVEPAKTAEELAREQELERLRKEQAELVARQRAADEALLRTYRSVDDLIMMRDGKIAAIDVMIQSIKGDIRRQQNHLTRLQAEAADYERVGQPLHPALERNIAVTQASIDDKLAAILRHERAKQDVYEKFANELERFRRLKDLKATPEEQADAARYAQLNNLVECREPRQCDQLWSLAIAYVEQHATLPIETGSSSVVMTAPPVNDEDISLIVSRIPNEDGKGGASIFLDLQCSNYSALAATCRTPARLAVLNGFRAALGVTTP